MPPSDRENAVVAPCAIRIAMATQLHEAHDAVLHKPLPKELLIAAGEGAAGSDALREDWGVAPKEGE